MKILAALAVIAFITSLSANERPKKGVYRLTKSHTITLCVTTNSEGACLKQKEVKLKKGNLIHSDRHFFDDKKMSWDIGIMYARTNVSLPINKLEFVGPSTCVNYRDAYNSMLTLLPNSCLKDNDCQKLNLLYDKCEGTYPAAKNISQSVIANFEWERKRLHKVCQFSHPPCHGVTEVSYCDNGICSIKKIKTEKDPDSDAAPSENEDKKVLPQKLPPNEPRDQ